MDTRYKVVTEGKLREGADPDQFATAFAQAFKVTEEQARKLLTAGRTVTLKEDVDGETAEKFRYVLTEQMGLEVRVEAKQAPGMISGGLSLEGKTESAAAPASGGGLSLEGETDSAAAPASGSGLSLEGESDSAAPASGGGLSMEGETDSTAAPASGGGLSLEGESGSPATPESSASTSSAGTGGRCPKCGSDRVSGDDCLACGVIISRYLARQAQMAEEAPSIYAAPTANVEPDQEQEQNGEFDLRRVDAGAGWQWIVGGWKLFAANPGIWIVMLIIWFAIILIAQIIPLIGPIATNLLGPVFSAGFMLGADEQRNGGDLTIGHLFAGFSREFGNLVLVGLLSIAAGFIIGLVLVIFGFGAVMFHANGGEPSAGSAFFLIILVVVLLAVMAMAFLFAPQLVVFERMGPIDAIKMSFVACWRNAIPFLVYGMILFGLAVVAAIPLFLGFIVLSPVMIASIYAAYRSIFYGDE